MFSNHTCSSVWTIAYLHTSSLCPHSVLVTHSLIQHRTARFEDVQFLDGLLLAPFVAWPNSIQNYWAQVSLNSRGPHSWLAAVPRLLILLSLQPPICQPNQGTTPLLVISGNYCIARFYAAHFCSSALTCWAKRLWSCMALSSLFFAATAWCLMSAACLRTLQWFVSRVCKIYWLSCTSSF